MFHHLFFTIPEHMYCMFCEWMWWNDVTKNLHCLGNTREQVTVAWSVRNT